MKDNQIAELVNKLTTVAKQYSQTEQLRDRISELLVDAVSADATELEQERKRLDWAISHDASYYKWRDVWLLTYTKDDGLKDVIETTDPRATIDELMKGKP